MVQFPHDVLNGQYPALTSGYLAANSVGTSEIGADTVGQSELTSSANAALFANPKYIVLSGGLVSGLIAATGYAPSMVIGVPKTTVVSGSKVLQPLTVSTITGSKIWARANTITPTGAMVAAATACWFLIGY